MKQQKQTKGNVLTPEEQAKSKLNPTFTKRTITVELNGRKLKRNKKTSCDETLVTPVSLDDECDLSIKDEDNRYEELLSLPGTPFSSPVSGFPPARTMKMRVSSVIERAFSSQSSFANLTKEIEEHPFSLLLTDELTGDSESCIDQTLFLEMADLIFKVSKKFRYHLETSYYALHYLAKFLRKCSFKARRRRMQLALCCICIAAKYMEEDKEPVIAKLLKFAALKIDVSEFKSIERLILNEIDWKLHFVSPFLVGDAILNATSIPLCTSFKEEIMTQAELKFRQIILHNPNIKMTVLIASAISVVFNDAFMHPVWDLAMCTLLKVDHSEIAYCKSLMKSNKS